jgi:ComF family protein
MTYINDFIGLIFPNICVGCGNSLWKNENVICTFCDFHLPRTDFHHENDNPLIRIFWGRLQIDSAATYLFFNKGNTVQQLVHSLKYKRRKDIGIWLGKQYGLYLKNAIPFNSADYIVPVPLHPKKFIKRGFNQSEQFAVGLSFSMNVPVETQVLYRQTKSETQTKKTRYLRWQNVEGIFAINEYKKFEGKHILLVDDVVTTGATLESCITALSGINGIRISIATIAFAAC